MEDVACPRCGSSGEITSPTGSGMTRCFACGGRGFVSKSDATWIAKQWGGEKTKSNEQPKSAKKPRTVKSVASSRKTVAKSVPAGPKPDPEGRTPLHREAADGYTKGVKELLEGGADPNALDNHGRTPLHWSSYRGHVEIVRMLLEAGANINVRDENGKTPLAMAAIGGKPEIVELLMEHGGEK